MMGNIMKVIAEAMSTRSAPKTLELGRRRIGRSRSASHTKKGPGRHHIQGRNAKPSHGPNRLCTIDNPDCRHLKVRL